MLRNNFSQFSNGIRRLNCLKLFILFLYQLIELKRLINPINVNFSTKLEAYISFNLYNISLFMLLFKLIGSRYLIISLLVLRESVKEVKILGEDIIDDPVNIKNVPIYDPENGVGAHYYAFSPYKAGYTKVTIHALSSIDIGIRNTGNGWHPYYYDVKNDKLEQFPENMAPSGTEKIGIEVEITSTKKIIFSISYRDSNLNIIKSFTTEFKADHIFENSDDFRKRFYRFASLVPIGGKDADNQNDETYMRGGQFTGLTIVENGSPKPWGIPEEDIESAWMVSSSRIEFSYDKNTDKFTIYHGESEKILIFLGMETVKNIHSYMFNYIAHY
ncbi:hypothetical protein H8356DRAFT_1429227 [Neocallimastix lanati (nom. inval.)]|nr:hypothetical protein H8356DRAFT_1429227 [Neocallimastix sp. JGI-2020a]